MRMNKSFAVERDNWKEVREK